MAKGLEGARAHTDARSIGLAQGALEDAIAYAKDRRQFGVPIAEYQAIRFKIASMATEIEAARQLLYFVCRASERHWSEAGELKHRGESRSECRPHMCRRHWWVFRVRSGGSRTGR